MKKSKSEGEGESEERVERPGANQGKVRKNPGNSGFTPSKKKGAH